MHKPSPAARRLNKQEKVMFVLTAQHCSAMLFKKLLARRFISSHILVSCNLSASCPIKYQQHCTTVIWTSVSLKSAQHKSSSNKT